MNELLEEKLEKPDAAFEHRILANFRERVPDKRGNIFQLVAELMRLRSAQIAGVAALLLALVQVGRLVTGNPERAIVTGSEIPTAEEAGPRHDLDEATGSSKNEAKFAESLNPPPAQPKPVSPDAGAFEGRIAGGSGGTFKSADMADHSGFRPEMKQKAVKRTDAISQFKNSLSTRMASEAPAKSATALAAASPTETPVSSTTTVIDQRKLIRNAKIDLEIIRFEDAVAKITQFASEDGGYVATSESQKQENGKLSGEVVVKILPQNLDRFLQKVRTLGDLKNQTLGSEDVTKAYFDTDARLKNARVMEQRLIDMLKTKTGKVTDLLQVEKELGRVREEVEKMQGELKYWDSQVQFATVTISLAEKDLEAPAAFLLKESDQVALFAADVEKTYNDIKALASSKLQVANSQLDRDNSGRIAAHLSMLIMPEESEAVVDKIKSLGRVGNFQSQTERIAQGGNPATAGENAKTKRDKVEVNITISRETDEQPVQDTSLRILTSKVDENAARLKDQAAKSGAEIRNSIFTRNPDGREVANISLRTPMKNYSALMKSLNQIGEVKDVSVQRHDRTDKNTTEETAPADISIQIYSQGNIVSSDTGLIATIRHTIAESAGAIMWSVRMIGVAIAFLAPWLIALVAVIWIVRRIAKARR